VHYLARRDVRAVCDSSQALRPGAATAGACAPSVRGVARRMAGTAGGFHPRRAPAMARRPPQETAGPMTPPRIGLALSGGGFRATCFGLGCLRALNDRDLLRYVAVISGISGGSLLAALYAYGPTDFRDLEALVVDQSDRSFSAGTA
jgi:Patatin-like phospholipase